jgi:hypothetical protein
MPNRKTIVLALDASSAVIGLEQWGARRRLGNGIIFV